MTCGRPLRTLVRVTSSPTISLHRRRFALYALFLLPGLSMSAWVTRTPAVRDLLDASTAQMGLVLFGLALFGGGMGGGEVAMNVEGADVERLGGRSFLPSLHGCFSLGTVIGAVLGILANGAGFPVVPHLVATAAVDATMGSLVFALFAASMTIGRFSGGPIVERVGRSRVLLVSALFAATGLALIAYVDSQAVAVVAVVLWGLGASLGFPLALSAAGDSGRDSAARVALASVIGYLAFLVGPPTLGFLGEEIGLRGALVVPLAVALLAAALSPATATRRPTAEEQLGTTEAGGGSAVSVL